MTDRNASCQCGQAKVRVEGAPNFVNACACWDCQKGTGSAFSYTAFFDDTAYSLSGEATTFESKSDKGSTMTVRFCPTCGNDLSIQVSALPTMIGVPVGLLNDKDFPTPSEFLFVHRKHDWYELGEGL